MHDICLCMVYALTNESNEIDSSFSTLNENKFIDLILYGSDKFDDKKNHNILISP